MDPKYVWRPLGSESLLNTPYYEIRRDRLLRPDGREVDYYVVRNHRRAAGIIPVGEDGRILLVQQWRHPVQKLLWSIPAGAIELNEEPSQAAARELQEETGYQARQVLPLHQYHPSVGISNQTYYLFTTTGLTATCQYDPGEIHRIAWFTPPQIEQMIDETAIQDGLSLTALLLYSRHCHNHRPNQHKDTTPMG
ncbi:MAG: NUDIX hydrolase [Bacillota bacterium]